METNKILRASLLDIVFDERNKNYGAYELRSRYSGRLVKSIGITTLLTVFVVLVSFVTSTEGRTVANDLNIKVLELVDIDKDPVPVEPPPPLPPPVEPPRLEMTRLASPKVVDDHLVNEDNEIKDIEELQDVKIGTENTKGDKDEGIVAPPIDEVHTGVVVAPQKDPDDELVIHVQIEAQYPGGAEAWRKYISKEMERRMDELQDDGKAGTCVVQFIVDRDGIISEVEALTMKGSKLAELCVAAIRKGPHWIPAENNGKKVKAYRRQPVTFQMINN